MISESPPTQRALRKLLMQDHGEVSSLFHTQCDYARSTGYEQLGKFFVWETVEECSTVALIELLQLLKSGNKLELLAWLKQHYPRHLKLVPAKRYAEFLKGVAACAERLKLYVLPQRLEEEVEASYTFCARSRPRSLLARLRPSPN